MGSLKQWLLSAFPLVLSVGGGAAIFSMHQSALGEHFKNYQRAYDDQRTAVNRCNDEYDRQFTQLTEERDDGLRHADMPYRQALERMQNVQATWKHNVEVAAGLRDTCVHSTEESLAKQKIRVKEDFANSRRGLFFIACLVFTPLLLYRLPAYKNHLRR
jgi:hypothetical protein